MGRKRFDCMDCSVAQALDVLGDWWTLLIVRDAFLGLKRFSEFERSLGIAKNVLSDRLGRLVDHGILERIPTSPNEKRNLYQLTDKGHALLPVITSLRQWADSWIYGQGKEPLRVIDRESGEPIRELELQAADGRKVIARDLRVLPGPGATEEVHRRFGEREAAN